MFPFSFLAGHTVFALTHTVNRDGQIAALLVLGHHLRGILHAIDTVHISHHMVNVFLDLALQGFQARRHGNSNTDVPIADPLNPVCLDQLVEVSNHFLLLVSFQAGFHIRDFAFQRFIRRAIDIGDALLVNLVEILKRLHDLIFHNHSPGIQIFAVAGQCRPAILDRFKGLFRADQRQRFRHGRLCLSLDAVQLFLDDGKLLHHNQPVG